MSTHNRTKSFFVSDIHLGIDTEVSSKERELLMVRWLNMIQNEARSIFLVGDIFDYWFEYKYVVPKGSVRLFGTLAMLADSGVEIHFFCGNHDLWVKDYFSKELGIFIHCEDLRILLDQKKFVIQHGDALIQNDGRFNFLRTLFRNKWAIYFFSWLHPSIAIPIMKYFSRKSREKELSSDSKTVLLDMIAGANEVFANSDIDFVVCGHCHQVAEELLANGKTRFVNLGDWTSHFTYGEWDGTQFEIKNFDPEI